jgi:hypothetical protein
MPMGLGGSPYWNPTGAFGQNVAPIGQHLWEQNPDIAYYSWGRSLGVPDDNSAFGRWFAQQFPQFQKGYGAFTAENPLTANITDYANSLGGFDDWNRRFMAQDPRLRGEEPSSRGAGPSRWIGR